jgi:two-component system, HptB-dependent secretion and biofilm response regulator
MNVSPFRTAVDPIGDATRNVVAASTLTLVIDDDPTVREMLVRLLRRAGHVAITADSAESGLELFRRHEPHIVLMDVRLPGMDGCSAMQLMKRERGDAWLPVILISALDTPEQMLEGLRAGADDYLTKPLKIEHVMVKLRNTTRSLRLQTQLSSSLSFARTIMDHLHEALLCCDEGGLVQTNNRAAESMFGYGLGELRDVPLATLLNGTVPSSWPGSESAELYGCGRRRDGSLFSIDAKQTSIVVDGRTLMVLTLRDVTQRLSEERRMLNDAARLREYKQAREAENALAQEMLDKLLRRDQKAVECLRYSTESATGFSGDVVTALRSPKGELFVLLADATGHGLAAAISLVPALAILHAMVARGSSLSSIVAELNSKMVELMPVGRFVAAALVCLNQDERRGEIWIGGIPRVFLLDQGGELLQSFDSDHLALGIVPTNDDTRTTSTFSWSGPGQLVLASDGVLEAENLAGEQFGERRFLATLSQLEGHERLEGVVDALRAHLGGLPAGDDASLALIDLA